MNAKFNLQKKAEFRTNDITTEEVQAKHTFRDYSDDEAEKIISIVKDFCHIAYHTWAKQEHKTILINIIPETNKTKAA